MDKMTIFLYSTVATVWLTVIGLFLDIATRNIILSRPGRLRFIQTLFCVFCSLFMVVLPIVFGLTRMMPT